MLQDMLSASPVDLGNFFVQLVIGIITLVSALYGIYRTLFVSQIEDVKTALQKDVKGVKTDVEDMRGEMDSDFQELKADIRELNREIVEVEDAVVALAEDTENVDDEKVRDQFEVDRGPHRFYREGENRKRRDYTDEGSE